MCLGIPGRIVSTTPGLDLGQVEVAGVVREINLALLDGPFVPGEFILIHSGFALERMSPERAADALAFFGPEADDAVPFRADG
ncbi:HypC/HybG/HupF family hydrogenase formation chaperone [Kribbella alba]|jgi:hydrogenase expression/formation protein HypC|uniref:HypC/HybG/HupF family hydrogenase formation chaperone n=1 Tax=Kribbella alba TaxID=190197 RepID=A0ABN2FWA5_9ACTN|nr:hydrogenase expression/formation protein HypC [Kribbellaceae bacterium]